MSCVGEQRSGTWCDHKREVLPKCEGLEYSEEVVGPLFCAWLHNSAAALGLSDDPHRWVLVITTIVTT